MKFLVTTSKSLLLINYIYKKDLITKVIHEGYGLYYGITYSESLIYVAARKRMLSSSEKSMHENGVILVFDKRLTLQKELTCLEFPLRDIHQIEYHLGKLYITCSFDNMVAIYDIKNDSWLQWFPNKNIKYKDVNHFNSFLIEGTSIYLLAHNFGDSIVYRFNINNLEDIQEEFLLGRYSHNIWKENNKIFLLSSGEESMRSTEGCIKVLDGFLRGLSISEHYYFVGSSEKVERKERDMTDGRIFILNKEFDKLDTLVLKNEGMVLDIKILNILDHSTNKIFRLEE